MEKQPDHRIMDDPCYSDTQTHTHRAESDFPSQAAFALRLSPIFIFLTISLSVLPPQKQYLFQEKHRG